MEESVFFAFYHTSSSNSGYFLDSIQSRHFGVGEINEISDTRRKRSSSSSSSSVGQPDNKISSKRVEKVFSPSAHNEGGKKWKEKKKKKQDRGFKNGGKSSSCSSSSSGSNNDSKRRTRLGRPGIFLCWAILVMSQVRINCILFLLNGPTQYFIYTYTTYIRIPFGIS